MKVLKTLTTVSICLIGFITSAQIDESEETITFKLIDVNKNEVITLNEMETFYKGKLDNDGNLINAKRLFYGLDRNRNTILTLSEYVKGVDWDLANQHEDKWIIKSKSNTAEHTGEVVESTENNKQAPLKDKEIKNEPQVKIEDVRGGREKNFTSGKPMGEDGIEEEFNNDLGLRIDSSELNSIEKKEDIALDPNNKRLIMFYEADVDNDGKLTLIELSEYYKDKRNKSGNPMNAELRFYGLDTNDDGFVSKAEYSTKINWRVANEKYSAKKQ